MSHNDIHTDVLIIGSGAVGATFARLLARMGRKITMLEAGKQLSDRPGEHLRNAFRYQQEPNLFSDAIASQLEAFSVPQSLFYRPNAPRENFENPDQKWWRSMPLASTAYAVGGMLTIWTASTPDPVSFERAPFIPEEDWAHMLAVGRRLLNVREDAFDHSLMGKAVKNRLEKRGFSLSFLPQGAENIPTDDKLAYFIKWTGADTILGPLLDNPKKFRDRFEILSEHRAEKLNFKGGKVKSVEVRDLRTYTTFTIHADTFIVAGGSFLTPRLLWQSGIRPYALGRYLNDNVESHCQVVVDAELLEEMRKMPGNPNSDKSIPIAHTDPGPALGFPPTVEKPWHGQVHRLGRQVIYLPGVDVRKTVSLTWYGIVDISPDNRIIFSEKHKDRFGMPQITVDFQYSIKDWMRAIRMRADMIRTGSAIGKVKGFIMISPPGSTLHFQGTYRMGEAEAEAVTDPFSKVWGYDNLYLGGLGNIPTSMASNPTLSACALAIHSAAHIRGDSLASLVKEVRA